MREVTAISFYAVFVLLEMLTERGLIKVVELLATGCLGLASLHGTTISDLILLHGFLFKFVIVLFRGNLYVNSTY